EIARRRGGAAQLAPGAVVDSAPPHRPYLRTAWAFAPWCLSWRPLRSGAADRKHPPFPLARSDRPAAPLSDGGGPFPHRFGLGGAAHRHHRDVRGDGFAEQGPGRGAAHGVEAHGCPDEEHLRRSPATVPPTALCGARGPAGTELPPGAGAVP